MSLRIAVSDPLPVFRHGLIAALGPMGPIPEAPSDLLAWSEGEQRSIMFLTLQSARDWSVLAELQATRADLVVIAVLVENSIPTYLRAILSGATAAVPRDASPERMQRVFEAAKDGESLLPFEVVRALAAAGEPLVSDEDRPTQRELEWLQGLARGETVARLAQRIGYSERAMFRQLRDLYTRMGVSNRTEALMLANDRGWL